jgi:hypothetical protein
MDHVEVVAPAQLREDITETLQLMNAQYLPADAAK